MAAEARRQISVIIVSYEPGDLLLRCLESVTAEETTGDVIIVDNGSEDRSVAAAQEAFPNVRVVRPRKNLGFAAGANLGASLATEELLLFLNPDVTLSPGCIPAVIRAFDEPSVGVVGPATYVVASGVLEFGATVDYLGFPLGLRKQGKPLYVPGCALATRGAVFRRLGGFDPRFFMFAEDMDYCWRALLAGWDVRASSEAHVVHVGGASSPGGYPSDSGVVTTRRRVYLRERNTLAALLKCYSWPAASTLIPLYIIQAAATAAVLTLLGKPSTAGQVMGGLAWNVKELSTTLRMRKQVQATRRRRDRQLFERMHHGFRKLELITEYGLPRVEEPA
jgi:N-acetylglucosaminyl-diphospho-decaprenol L-rhamnosyltransferase